MLVKRFIAMGVAFQHCNFFFNFSKNMFGKKNCSPFYSNFFSIISEKEVKIIFFQIFYSKMFFEKLNYIFSKKVKLVTLCHYLGKARDQIIMFSLCFRKYLQLHLINKA